MYNLNEDNKSLLEMIRYVDSKIVSLREENKLDQDIANYVSKIYEDTVDVWMEHNYLKDIEPDSRWEQEITDELLKLIGYLNLL
jgi:hypothetical protein